MDIIISSIILIIFVPVIIIIILLLQFNLGRPYFFIQLRPGLNSVPFKLIKFRTMKNLRDNENKILDDKYRITKLGKFLRETSLDEIISLINVIKGDMSLVGPRPLLMEYLKLYNSSQKDRHLVRPGITGWAQINGRNSVSWEEKFELDVWYVDNQSFWLDIKIIFITIWKVLKREGISHKQSTTMPKFRGNKSIGGE
jgi:lipopolysaccharide/colanic/teichoic acid biosynthesis glycosyltransferase